ncbi:MAG: 1-phosphofructokinase [Frankiales bacterium]|jgi:1-phosphofructokinase|nr:1-phosphofructokinase [Frankiales bacterium]
MIVTLTANPSVDRTVEVDALVRGAVLRATGTRVDPGGKGVNVSRALAAHGLATCAVLPCGGAEGIQLAELLASGGVEVRAVPIAGAVRANVSVVEPDGTVTKLNEPGPALSPAEVAALLDATADLGSRAAWVVLSGSLPPGCPDDVYARLIARLPGQVAVDSSGAPFARALPAGPDLVKPNREELEEVTGLPVSTVGEVVTAARSLIDRGAKAVLASLGADGAVLVDGTGAWYGESPVDCPVSSVGAGDATLAGFLAGGGQGPEALREALAYGAAAVRLPGSRMPVPSDLDRSAVLLADTVPTDRDLKGQ